MQKDEFDEMSMVSKVYKGTNPIKEEYTIKIKNAIRAVYGGVKDLDDSKKLDFKKLSELMEAKITEAIPDVDWAVIVCGKESKIGATFKHTKQISIAYRYQEYFILIFGCRMSDKRDRSLSK